MKRVRARLLVPAALGLLLAACHETRINDILAEPGRWADREVLVVGDVVRSVSLLGRGAYMLDDGTGELWVVTRRGAPRQGARVAVRGRVRDIVNLGDIAALPPEVGSGLVLIEREHRAR